MVREPSATRQPTPHDFQLMSKHRFLSFKPQLRLEWRGQDGQSETEQPDHSTSLGDSITSSTRMSFRYTQPSRARADHVSLLQVGDGTVCDGGSKPTSREAGQHQHPKR